LLHRCTIALMFSVVLAAPIPAAAATLPVTLTHFVGLPPDSLERAEFLDGFHAAMDADLPCELKKGDVWSDAGPRRNLFRLVDVAPPDEAWSLDLSLGLPPTVRVTRAAPKHSKSAPHSRMSSVRASRGLIIVVTVTSPANAMHGVVPEPRRFSVFFADARRILVPSPQVPGGGYEYWWSDAGAVVARAALEVLHRATGEMADDERAALRPATRLEEAAQ
jgi:hypothetical protein